MRVEAGLLGLALLAGCNRMPEGAAEHLRRGDAALAEGQIPRAIVAYSRARELAPNDPTVQRSLMRARVYGAASSPERIAPDTLDDVQYDAQFLLDTDKPHADVYLTALGNVFVRRGNLDAAKLEFAEAIKENPSSPTAHAALGLALASRKETAAQAKSELEQALKAKPDHATALRALGELELADGRFAQASERLEAALRLNDDAGTRIDLGRLRVQQQRPAEAIEHFQKAVQLDPRSPDALRALGEALLAAGRADEAERALRASAQLRGDPGTATSLGFALERQRKSEQAFAVFQEVLAQDSSAAQALFGAGVTAQQLGRREQALDLYRRLLAVPEEGPQKAMVTELHQEARTRVTAITAVGPAVSASASASAKPPDFARRF